jgi:anthranilate synthase component 1
MRSGAGIVADSDPDREYEETENKAKAVFEAAKLAEELS